MKQIQVQLKFIKVFLLTAVSLSFLSCDSCEHTHKKHREISTDPQLGYSVPDKGAYNVSTTGIIDIIFFFNERVNIATINKNTFIVSRDGGSDLSGTVTYNGSNNSARFTPDAVLSPGTYTATLKSVIKFDDGTSLDNDYCWSFTTSPRSWTIMIYLDGDNNIENFMMEDIEEMMSGYTDLQGYDVIILVDRINGYTSNSSTLGDNFTDTRLYRITNNLYTRLEGGTLFPEITRSSTYEANMGNAQTLGKFISFCKSNYSADKYALVLWNHGDGVRSPDMTTGKLPYVKAICQDETNHGDILYTAEITDILSADHSVDVLGFDACLMGSAEVAYQYRPAAGKFGADYMVASPANEWSAGWKYDDILARIQEAGGTNDEIDSIIGNDLNDEAIYNPASMTNSELCSIIIEEQYDSTTGILENQTLSCYDLSQITAVKTAVDALAGSLVGSGSKINLEDIRGSDIFPVTINYFSPFEEIEWISIPYFDLYDLCERIKDDTTLPTEITNTGGYADNVLTAVDSLVIYSFAGSDFDPSAVNGSFTRGSNGIHIFFPDGDRLYYDQYDDPNPHWLFQWWYNSIDFHESQNEGYGKLDWCIDGAIPGNSTVENWFELLDSWFDTNNDPYGGQNMYQY